jgi:acyl carrier protein
VRQIEQDLRYFVITNFLYGRENGFSDTDSFLDMGIIDSTGMLELVGYLENTYGIEVEDSDLIPQNLDSIGQLADFVRRKCQRMSLGESAALQRQTA